MIKVSVSYPNDPMARFDWKYFLEQHCPLVKSAFGDSLKGFSIERGLSGGAPNSVAPFHAQAHFLFESVEAFQAAFAPNAQIIEQDTPRYTTISPDLQINQVELFG